MKYISPIAQDDYARQEHISMKMQWKFYYDVFNGSKLKGSRNFSSPVGYETR